MSETQRIPIVLPDLGAGDQPVRFAQWLVEDGDRALEQDRVAEVLVSGILFHVTSPAEGVISHAIEREGALLSVNEIVGFVSIDETERGTH